MKARYNGSTGTSNWTLRITKVKGNTYKFVDHGETSIWRRCSRQDIVAGIGLPVQLEESDEVDKSYPHFYARAVPGFCPNLEVHSEWQPSSFISQQIDAMTQAKRDAESDNENLPDFCRKVLSAFGRAGHVIPNLLRAR